MSTEHGSGERFSKEGTRTQPLGTTNPEQSGEQATQSKPSSPQRQEGEQSQGESIPSDQKPSPQLAQTPSAAAASPTGSNVTATTASERQTEESTRQVIAVSASKGPAAFFNLARKFLATDEMCDLSALEGAIVSAVDAAHLLERSQLATIVRVNTSYVTVEPKRRKQTSKEQEDESTQTRSPTAESPTPSGGPRSGSVSSISPAPDAKPSAQPSQTQDQVTMQQAEAGVPPSARQGSGRSSGRELRRARIVITVRRTESYKRWLEENPLQAIIASEGEADAALEHAPRGQPKSPE